MNGHGELNGQNVGIGETITYTNECFHCTNDPDKYSTLLLSKEQLPYCDKCFQSMFVGVVSEEQAPVFKTKPPPAPPKPSKGKPLILFSTLPKPYQSTMTTLTKSSEFEPVKTPPLPSPPPPMDTVFSVEAPVVEQPLPPPPPFFDQPNNIKTPSSFDRKTSPVPNYGGGKIPSPPSSVVESNSSRTTTSSPSVTLGLGFETNGYRRTPSPTPALSSQIKSLQQQQQQPSGKAPSTSSYKELAGGGDVPRTGNGKPLAQSSVLAAVQAEQEEKLKEQNKVKSYNRQPSLEQEESHLDQLNSIFKMTSLKQKPKVNYSDDESEVNSQSTQSNVKPTIPANKPSFNCSKCKINLMGRTVESKGGKVFCTPCYKIEIANQTCVKCGDPFTPENHSVTYQNENYHTKCFLCDKCQLPIGAKTFCKQQNGVYCSDCYFEVSGRICVKCKKFLTSTGFIFRNEPYHHACFSCGDCQKLLGDQEIFCKGKNDQPYCVDCFDKDLEKCAACSKPLVGETVEYEQKSYHDNCFCCQECKAPIGSASFFPREGRVFCETCFSIKFGKTCKKCQLIISPSTGFGLVFRDSHFHRDCFKCESCQISLAGIPVHSAKSSDHIYCGDCYDVLYAKRCAGCQQIISGIIGSRFMSFQDKTFHVECFVCASCNTSLENRKFVPSQGAMLCIACSKFSPYSQ